MDVSRNFSEFCIYRKEFKRKSDIERGVCSVRMLDSHLKLFWVACVLYQDGACGVKGEAKEDGGGEKHGEGRKEGPDAVTPEVVQNGKKGGVEKKPEAGGQAGGDGEEE